MNRKKAHRIFIHDIQIDEDNMSYCSVDIYDIENELLETMRFFQTEKLTEEDFFKISGVVLGFSEWIKN